MRDSMTAPFFKIYTQKNKAGETGGTGNDVARSPRAPWHDHATLQLVKTASSSFFLLPPHSPSSVFSLYRRAPPLLFLTITHPNLLQIPQISFQFLQFLHNLLLFSPNSSSFPPFHPTPLSLSKALTSIVDVEGCSKRNCTSSCHSKPLPPLHNPHLFSIHTHGQETHWGRFQGSILTQEVLPTYLILDRTCFC